MPQSKSYNKTITIGHSVQDAYNVVADVEKYPEFVPFCVACVISSTETLDEKELEWQQLHPEGKIVFADTSVGFKLFKETYLSRIRLIPEKSIEVCSNNTNLFILLWSKWEFEPVIGNPNACIIHFSVEFEFKSAVYAKVANYFFEYVSSKNLEAFQRRIHEVSHNGSSKEEEPLSLANALAQPKE